MTCSNVYCQHAALTPVKHGKRIVGVVCERCAQRIKDGYAITLPGGNCVIGYAGNVLKVAA